jgi:hypothetical protein
MTREELEQRLSCERIDPAAYDLDGVGKEEAYCIERTPDGWFFYYRERGHHNFEHSFSSESEAIEFFLKEILQDPTTRKRGSP